MTAPFRMSAPCKCGRRIPLQDDISTWIRNHPQLKSENGFVFMDKDLIVHRYKTTHGREFQCLMCVEIKTHGANVSDSQMDTIDIFNEAIRNRTTTPTKKIPSQLKKEYDFHYSRFLKRDIKVRLLGYHIILLSNNTPDDSEIKWDNKPICKETLLGLLRFDLDPDTLKPMDFRLHHKDYQQKLF